MSFWSKLSGKVRGQPQAAGYATQPGEVRYGQPITSPNPYPSQSPQQWQPQAPPQHRDQSQQQHQQHQPALPLPSPPEQSQTQASRPHPSSNTDAEKEQQLAQLHKFAHILHLPMFPPWSGDDAFAAQKEAQLRQEIIAQAAGPKVSVADKVGLKLLGLATGTEFVSMDKMVSGALKFSDAVLSLGNLTSEHVKVTRWASARETECVPIILDVMEQVTTHIPTMAIAYIKASRDVKIRINDNPKYEKKVKRGSEWFMGIGVMGRCDKLVIVELKGGQETALEKVLAVEATMTTTEFGYVMERWKKRWQTPTI